MSVGTHMNILDRIDRTASLFPDSIAHIHREQRMTYKELADTSDRIAGYLAAHLENDHSPVVVYGHKQSEMLSLFLGCVKAGHPYIPVDSSLPSGRVEDIVTGSGAHLLFAAEQFPIATSSCPIIDPDELAFLFGSDEYGHPDPALRVREEDVYYIIYTSGSTGKPKGVQITLHNLHSFIQWAVPLARIREGEHPRVLNTAAFSFDLSVMDTYIALATGGTLVSTDKPMIANPKELFSALSSSGVSVIVCTPSFADMCLADASFSQDLMRDLKTFLFCGETLSNRTAGDLLDRFPQAEVINLYGPTEATVSVTAVDIDRTLCDRPDPLPVGRVKPDCDILIRDASGGAAPDGERGEIVIAGDSVSIGYYNNPEGTAKVFGPVNGRPAYRTGDEGYLLDGMLYYCGRLDFQVKLNGYRIETEDVENNIRSLHKVANAVVLPVYAGGKVTHLSAFVILRDSTEDTSLKGAIALKKELRKQLPEYMIPKHILFVDHFPVNANGKIDRKALAGEVR